MRNEVLRSTALVAALAVLAGCPAPSAPPTPVGAAPSSAASTHPAGGGGGDFAPSPAPTAIPSSSTTPASSGGSSPITKNEQTVVVVVPTPAPSGTATPTPTPTPTAAPSTAPQHAFIEGTAKAADGTPITRGTVQVGSGSSAKYAMIMDGTFILAAMHPGSTVTVKGEAEGFVPAEATVTVLPPAQGPTRVELVFTPTWAPTPAPTPTPHVISGRYTWEVQAREGVFRATVTLYRYPDGELDVTASADSPPGNYRAFQHVENGVPTTIGLEYSRAGADTELRAVLDATDETRRTWRGTCNVVTDTGDTVSGYDAPTTLVLEDAAD